MLATLSQVAALLYILWRATRSLGNGPILAATIPFFLFEFFSLLLGSVFVMGLWNMIERPRRMLTHMLTPEEFPAVDVFVVCYSEPVEVRGGGHWQLAVRRALLA